MPFTDVHCHLLPGIDDGAKSWDESVDMARMAAADGTETVIVTPHQLGSYGHNDGDAIRARTRQLQALLDERSVPLTVLSGADVRIEPDLVARLRRGEVVSLADRMRHVLLELPHEMYIPLDGVLEDLRTAGMVGILSHPERNLGLLRRPQLLTPLLENGCLMQVTAGSILGAFGRDCRETAERMLQQGQVHFVATDAHGARSRRPLMQRAFERVAALMDRETAVDLFCRNPACVAGGRDIERASSKPRRNIRSWFGRRKAS